MRSAAAVAVFLGQGLRCPGPECPAPSAAEKWSSEPRLALYQIVRADWCSLHRPLHSKSNSGCILLSSSEAGLENGGHHMLRLEDARFRVQIILLAEK